MLLGVPDAALAEQLGRAAAAATRSAVMFGTRRDAARPLGLRERCRDRARMPAWQLCGAGCMGFVNVATGVRAIGYVEPEPLPAGPVALVTHSGSVFSTLLRSRRGVRFHARGLLRPGTGHHAADYLEYALAGPTPG